jgi:hypothetical protein
LVAANAAEHEQLGDALTANDRRECVARALSEMASSSGLPDEWDMPSLELLRSKLESIQRAVDVGLPIVVDAVLVTEGVFQILLWWGTQQPSKPIDELLAGHDFQKAIDRCCETAVSLRTFRDGCERTEVREAIKGLIGFAYAIDQSSSPRLIVDEILHRHHYVQSGKVDGGVPKRDWIAFDGGKLLRPSPRFQHREPPSPALGKALTHPYRLEPFVYMLRENNLLPQRKMK